MNGIGFALFAVAVAGWVRALNQRDAARLDADRLRSFLRRRTEADTHRRALR